MHFTPKPAAIQKRVMAGLIDAAFILVLEGITFVAPLMVKGVVLPMWGVLAVLIGYAVVPIAFFKRTIGLQIMNIEVVSKTGHPLDLANTAFRELLGRGYFSGAYLFTAIGSLIALKFGIGASIAPPLLIGVMTLASSIAFIVAAMGHLVALGRPDKRTLADLISGSFVVEGSALPKPTDLEELDELSAQRTRVIRNVVIFEVLIAASVIAMPYVISSKGGESPEARGRRIKIDSLRAKFDANPGSDSLTAELQRELSYAGRNDEVQEVTEKHRTALSLKEAQREESLRAQFEQNKDRASAQTLIALLEEQDRVDEARVVYLEWLGPTPEASELNGFGNWLATNGKTDEAIAVLRQAIALDPLVPYSHTLLGVSLQRMDKLDLAREELHLALLDDPDDEDAFEALREVEEKLGVLPATGVKALKQRFDAWAKDAGR